MTEYSSEDFWEGAPEGATHYNAAQGKSARLFSSMKVEAGLCIWHYYDGNLRRWVRQHEFPTPCDVLVARPTPPWSGEGLPPVGTECECRVTAGADWVQCVVVAHHKQYAIAYVDDDTVMLSCGIRFRPIKPPAQIAADEREHSIRNACTAISTSLNGLHESEEPTALAIIEAMIDAGYHKGDDQ